MTDRNPFERPADTKWNLISLGAGVQSSAMALMAAAGDLSPMPDGAIFADTGAEPKAVYEWLDYLEQTLPFPVYRVKASLSLEEDAFRVRHRASDGLAYSNWTIPVFTKNDNGSADMRGRQCTRNYKIRPLMKLVRSIVMPGRGTNDLLCSMWIGISLDEAQRAKRAPDRWVVNRFPLLEKRLTRLQCLQWLDRCGYPKPPRSACVMCPFHSDSEWMALRDRAPQDFKRAVEFERKLQSQAAQFDLRPKTPYLHRSMVPLSEVEFHDASKQMDMWQTECEGMCGL